MKIIKFLPLFASFLILPPALNADLILKGDSGASLLDISNYYDSANMRSNISSYIHDGNRVAFYTQEESTPSETMPGYGDGYPWIGIGEFTGVEEGCSPLEIVLPSTNKMDMGGWYSGQRIQTVFSFGGRKNMTISLGSKDTSDANVTYNMASFQVVLENADSTVSVVRAADASQTTFQVNADNPIRIYSGTVNFGTKETGALDKVTGANVEVFSGAVLNTYIKNLNVYHYDGNGRNLTVGGTLNFQVAELVEGSELITVTGSCSTQGGIINFDFTDFEVGDGTYDLINAAGGFSLNGAPGDELSMDFGIVGLEKYDLAFNADRTILQLTVVPEPAEIAALLGGLCFGLAAFRRRR